MYYSKLSLLVSSFLVDHFSAEAYHSSSNQQHVLVSAFLAFSPVGKCHVTLHAPSVAAARGAQEWRVFPGFCEEEGVLGWHGNMACWPGMNWLAHCVPDRETQMPEEWQQERLGCPVFYSTSALCHVLTAWHVLQLACVSHSFTHRCQNSVGFSELGKADMNI